MATLYVRLFGKFSVRLNDRALECLHGGKAQELFCYLLLHRNRPHPRETLAALLWGDCTTTQSKKYLRQALWQLQLALRGANRPRQGRALIVESDSVRLDPEAGLWLDVAVFEKAADLAHGVPGEQLDARRAQTLRSVLPLYDGDLLEGWYQEWCLYERERLQNIYQAMLDKLMAYCEAQHDYETGLLYGERILRQDRARERTHLRLMRMQYLAGDRAGALRQYERCATALQEELGVKPARGTIELYEQIRTDRLEGPAWAAPEAKPAPPTVASPVPKLLAHLRQLQRALQKIQRRVQQDIQAVEQVSTTRANLPSLKKH